MREYRHKDEKTFHWVSFTYSGFIWVYTLPAKVWNCCSSASQAHSGLAKPNAKVYFEVEKRVNIIEQRYVNWLMRNDVSFTFVILPLHVLTVHFFFVTDNVQKWQRGDHFFPREQFFDTVSCWLTLTVFDALKFAKSWKMLPQYKIPPIKIVFLYHLAFLDISHTNSLITF